MGLSGMTTACQQKIVFSQIKQKVTSPKRIGTQNEITRRKEKRSELSVSLDLTKMPPPSQRQQRLYTNLQGSYEKKSKRTYPVSPNLAEYPR